MKKYIFFIPLVLSSILIYYYAYLNFPPSGNSVVRAQAARDKNWKIDSTKFNSLRVVITQDSLFSDTIKSNFSDLNALEDIISPRYEKLKKNQSFIVDSCFSRYHLKTIWKKEKIIKTIFVSYSNKAFSLKQKDDSKILANFECLLLVILIILLLYLELNRKKLSRRLEWVMLSGMMLILYVAWPSDQFTNAFAILFIPLALVSFVFKSLVYGEIPRSLSVIFVLSIFSGYLFGTINFVLLTLALGGLTALIIKLKKKKNRRKNLFKSSLKPITL